MPMEEPKPLAITRRNEDIALDLMRFVAETTNYTRSGAKGFHAEAGQVNEEQAVKRLLNLYRQCVSAVEGR